MFFSRDSLRLVSIRKALRRGIVTLFSNLYFSPPRPSTKTVHIIIIIIVVRVYTIYYTQLFSNVVGLRNSRPSRPGIHSYTDKRNRDKSSLDAIIHIIILSNSIKNNQNHLLQYYLPLYLPTFVIFTDRFRSIILNYAHACPLIGRVEKRSLKKKTAR